MLLSKKWTVLLTVSSPLIGHRLEPFSGVAQGIKVGQIAVHQDFMIVGLKVRSLTALRLFDCRHFGNILSRGFVEFQMLVFQDAEVSGSILKFKILRVSHGGK